MSKILTFALNGTLRSWSVASKVFSSVPALCVSDATTLYTLLPNTGANWFLTILMTTLHVAEFGLLDISLATTVN